MRSSIRHKKTAATLCLYISSLKTTKAIEKIFHDLKFLFCLVSKFRPYLTSYVKGRNDYINAVCVHVSGRRLLKPHWMVWHL